MKINCLLPFLCVLSWPAARAQDPQFSQFYGSSTYQNPAFVGQFDQVRAMTTYRAQWPQLGTINTTLFAIDGGAVFDENDEGKVGLGLTLMNYKQDRWYNLTAFSGQFAYKIYAGGWRISMGIQAGMNTRRWGDLSDYTFVDQYVATGNGLAANRSYDPLATASFSENNWDFGVGILADLNNNGPDDPRAYPTSWIGLAYNHLQYPFLGNKETYYWQRAHASLHGGIKIPVSWIRLDNSTKIKVREEYFSIMGNLRSQFGGAQLDLMTLFTYSPLVLGAGYRGIPLKKVQSHFQQDAVTFLTGVRFGSMLIQYSYDQTISSLIGYTGGSHEVTLWIGLSGDLFKYTLPSWRRKHNTNCYTFD